MKNEWLYQGFFCDGTCWYGIPGNENEDCIFCMLVLQYHIINHGLPGPSGTFLRETVRMYENPGDQNIFQTRKLGGKKFLLDI